jgi:7-cyano-7-deazaguanine synthase in queuosine biosynthesis
MAMTCRSNIALRTPSFRIAICGLQPALPCWQRVLGIRHIAIGIVGGGETSYPDTTAAFIRKLNRMLRLSADIRVLAPFAQKTKTDIAKFAWEHDFDYGLTYSCHTQSKMHCGTCAGCIERERAAMDYPPITRTHYRSPVGEIFA